MISLKDYLNDPCGTLSIPYWKWQQTVLPDGLKIVHQRDFVPVRQEYQDEPYFRLRHDLKNICVTELDAYTVKASEEGDIPDIVSIINGSYSNIRVTKDQVHSWQKYPVYDPDLWLIAIDETRKTVGCAIADLDGDAKEGILEWIQVLPEYRGRGIGKLLVSQLLCRMQGKADFATVSGSCLNESNPEKLYRSCGFSGADVWHIQRKR